MGFFTKLRRMLVDIVLGPVWRIGPSLSESPILYLTFDDGPEPGCTDRVLDLLKKYEVSASFFVIVEKAKQHSELVLRAQAQGHAIGNHSLDHRYRRYFGTRAQVLDWVTESEKQLTGILSRSPVAWRAPAGIRTPELRHAIRELNLALVHWDVRFYDTTRSFTKAAVLAKMSRLRSGSVILLHDCHRGAWSDDFLETLEWFLVVTKERGFQFSALPPLGCAENSKVRNMEYSPEVSLF